MEILVSVIIVVLVLIWAYSRRQSSRARASAKFTRAEIVPRISVEADVQSKTEHPDTAELTRTTDGGWTLNPRSTFPLTIYGVDESAAKEFNTLLDQAYSRHDYAYTLNLVEFVARTNLHCKEIDHYVNEFKAQYVDTIEELKRSSAEWATASELDQEDMLADFRDEAIGSLAVRPDSDLQVLFECEPADATIDDALLSRFGYKNLDLYFRHAANMDKVRAIPTEHYERAGFENLVELGLAIRGSDISLSAILEALTLKQMNDAVADLTQKPFGRKAKAVEFLTTLPDVKERVNKVVAFRELFQLRDLPVEFSHIDRGKITDAWKYANEVANIISRTYIGAAYETRDRDQYGEVPPYVLGRELSPINDDRTCPHCERAGVKKYSRTQRPTVPLHLACRCSVLAILKH